jgi:hypothetical protein
MTSPLVSAFGAVSLAFRRYFCDPSSATLVCIPSGGTLTDTGSRFCV